MLDPTTPFFVAREAHSTIVPLIGHHPYKVKKPLNLGLLDSSTLADRKRSPANRRSSSTA
jgi:aminoglycoside phosphotransferase family enzyme